MWTVRNIAAVIWIESRDTAMCIRPTISGLWGPPFCGAPVRPNMPKSVSVWGRLMLFFSCFGVGLSNWLKSERRHVSLRPSILSGVNACASVYLPKASTLYTPCDVANLLHWKLIGFVQCISFFLLLLLAESIRCYCHALSYTIFRFRCVPMP